MARYTRHLVPVGLVVGLAILAGMLVTTCAGPDEQVDPSVVTDTAAARADPADDAPPFELSRLLDRVHERGAGGELLVLDDLPPPANTIAEAVQNRHDPALTDTVRTLAWPGLEVSIYEVTRGGREMVQEITVTSRAWRTPEGIGVGSTRDEVRTALGEPVRTEDGMEVWDLPESETDPTPTAFRIAWDGDRVARLEYGYYVD